MYSHAILCVALVGAVCGAPNHLKHVAVDKQVVASGGGLGASASWGPFSAGAGLSDTGIATAGAQAPGAGAGAGIGGGSSASASASASAGAGTGSHISGGGSTFFDQIFNIPISVLKSVNDHLNTKETVPGAQSAHRRLRKCRRRGICDEGVTVHGSAGANSGAGAQASAGAGDHSGADASASVSAYAKHAGSVGSAASADAGAQAGSGASTLSVRKNYDSVFAIPISALTSVNQLLNGIVPFVG